MLFQFTKKLATNFKKLSSSFTICSKMFQRLLYKEMFGFFIGQDLISGNRSSFKPADSCINQLLLITHDIYKSFDDDYEFKVFSLTFLKLLINSGTMILLSNQKVEDNGISGILRYYDQIYNFSTTSLELDFWRIGICNLAFKTCSATSSISLVTWSCILILNISVNLVSFAVYEKMIHLFVCNLKESHTSMLNNLTCTAFHF